MIDTAGSILPTLTTKCIPASLSPPTVTMHTLHALHCLYYATLGCTVYTGIALNKCIFARAWALMS